MSLQGVKKPMPLLTNHVWVVGAQWMKHLLLLSSGLAITSCFFNDIFTNSQVILLINTVKLQSFERIGADYTSKLQKTLNTGKIKNK